MLGLGRGAGLLAIPPLRLRCILGQMDGPISEDGLSGKKLSPSLTT